MNSKHKIAVNTPIDYNVDVTDTIVYAKNAGFDGFFTDWNKNAPIEKFAEFAEKQNMIYQSIHAPFGRAAEIFEDGDNGDDAICELCECVTDCGRYGVPVVVMHPYIGFRDSYTVNPIGLSRYEKVVALAEKSNVKIGFENVEGEEYLEALMKHFKGSSAVGFTWDSGHESCYNRGKDMLALYGDRLVATHLNDNMGVIGEKIYFTDDLHLLPYDGIIDWNDAARRLEKCGYRDILTFELKLSSENTRKYCHMSLERFYAEIYDRAQKILSE